MKPTNDETWVHLSISASPKMKSTNNNKTPYSNAAFYIICFFIAFTPLARGSVHLWSTTLIQTGILMAIILLILESLKTNKPLFPKTPLTWPLITLILLALISTLLSNHKSLAWEGFLLLLTYIAAYFITQSSIRTREQQRILIYVIISTALFLSIFGLFKRFGLNPFPFWEYGELKYSPDMLASTYGNHNHLAGFIEMAIPFLLALFLTRSRSLSAILIIIYLILILLAVQALTLSRGGWISTLGAIVFMVMVLLSQRKFQSKKLILLLAGSTLVISAFILASTPIVERVMTLAEKDESASMESRLKVWTETVELIKDHPYIGTGPGTYAAEFTNYQPPGLSFMFIQAHNDYLHFTADMGLLVIPVMLWILFIFFKMAFQNVSDPSRQTRGFALSAMASVVAILIHSVSDFNLLIPANALLFTVIAGIVTHKNRSQMDAGFHQNG